MYRDASNYKQWGQVTFSNPEKAGTENLDYQLQTPKKPVPKIWITSYVGQ
jgi:hypothetical protein